MGIKFNGGSGAIVQMQGASTSTAGTSGTTPAPAAGAVSRVLRADATWVEPDIKSTVATIVQEFGVVENAASAWNGKTLILGGLKFQWSGAASNTGYLTMVKATGSDAPANTAASQIVMKQAGNTFSGLSSINYSVWPNIVKTFTTVPTITSYQKLEFDISTRGQGETTAVWKITAQATGSTTLVLSGTYIGPRYITGT
jgi:hypothetical protein